MRKKGLFLTIILAGLLLFSSCAGLRINTEIENLGINFGDRDSVLRFEKDPALFRLWTHWKPIELLMTGEEKKLAKKILKIQDDAERNAKAEAFVKWFWERRDDNAYDAINEFKDNFYNRLVEAQIRFANTETVSTMRRCAYGKGWQTDLGMIYIALGEPFDKARYDVRDLMNFLGRSYRDSALMPQEIEVWYYETPEDFIGTLFSNGVAWIMFEKDASGYWRFGETTFSLFFSYENYYDIYSYFMASSLTYSTYINDVHRLIEAFAESYIYDEDSEFEDIS
jgi:GWxTD domain-containing protein